MPEANLLAAVRDRVRCSRRDWLRLTAAGFGSYIFAGGRRGRPPPYLDADRRGCGLRRFRVRPTQPCSADHPRKLAESSACLDPVALTVRCRSSSIANAEAGRTLS